MAQVWYHLFEGMSSIKLILGKISGVLAVDYNVVYCLHVINNKYSLLALLRSLSLDWMGIEMPVCKWERDGL